MSKDSTTAEIDRFYDFVDGVVDKAAHFFRRMGNTEAKVQAAHEEKRRVDRIAAGAPARSRVAWRIDEFIDGVTGKMIYVVTDGGNAKAECTTKELAMQLLRALEMPS